MSRVSRGKAVGVRPPNQVVSHQMRFEVRTPDVFVAVIFVALSLALAYIAFEGVSTGTAPIVARSLRASVSGQAASGVSLAYALFSAALASFAGAIVSQSRRSMLMSWFKVLVTVAVVVLIVSVIIL